MPDLLMSGDGRQTFDSLVRPELSYLWNSLRRLGVPERDREDVLQEILVRVHRAIPEYDASRPARPWLFAFAFRLASDYRKRARVRDHLEWTDHAATTPTPEEDLDVARRRALLERAIQELDLDKRAVLILHDIDGIAVTDAARTLGIPEGTAYTRLRAARTELAATLRRSLIARGGPS